MSAMSSARVLVVHALEAEAHLLMRALEAAGYANLVHRRDVESAMAEIVASPPRLVVTDHEVGAASGIELARQIRALDASLHIYVVMLMSSASDDLVRTCFQAGVDDFIERPFRNETVIARVHAGERILELESTLRTRSRELETALRRIDIATTQRTSSRAAGPLHPSPASGATPLDALLGTETWRDAESLLTTAMAEFFQLPFAAVAPQDDPADAFVAEISLSEPTQQLELGLSVVIATDAMKQLGAHLLGDEDLEGAQALVLEVANILMGTLKTAFTAHALTFTGGIPTTETYVATRTLFDQATLRRRMAIGADGSALELWLRLKEKRNTTVRGRHLHEGLVVCNDIHDARGVLVARAGSRLTHTTIERLARLLPDAEIAVSDPSA
jgi:DNA-binding response OmpR family regulator